VAALGCVACVFVDVCNVGTTWLLLLCLCCDSDCDCVEAFKFPERGDVYVCSGWVALLCGCLLFSTVFVDGWSVLLPLLPLCVLLWYGVPLNF